MSKTSQRKLSYYQQGQSDARKGIRQWVPPRFLKEYRDGYAEVCAQQACEYAFNEPTRPLSQDYMRMRDTPAYLLAMLSWALRWSMWRLARPDPALPTTRI